MSWTNEQKSGGIAYLLLESLSFLLQENGDKLLLDESQVFVNQQKNTLKN
jgi:hypothetical protein